MTTRSPYLDAVSGATPAHMPVWFMRQAGRALAEYRAIREDHDFEDVVHTPDLTAEVTLQPVRRYGVDAAILFSDIVTPLQGIGLPIEIVKGTGPVTDGAFRTRADVDRLRPLDPDADVPWVLESVAILAAELGDVPLIGFAGAPFTLASYLIEGRPSRNYAHTKALMRTDRATWDLLMARLSDLVATHLVAQVKAGARAVQLFDSWAGALTPSDYAEYVQPWSQHVLARVGDLGVPRTHFGVATGELLGLMATEVEVIGVDWRVPLDDARTRVPASVATQGNLDPTAVLAGVEVARSGADDVLARVGDRTDHVFNLGHGVLPATDPGVLADLVAHVHERTRR
ncbi:MAG TPA: uroporphyrinogen decarboxylase [Nitriliruptoraceae bacterium]|nr:uroporphyrinogen decarboxylase [Nitriliruptoraceae bacterium]